MKKFLSYFLFIFFILSLNSELFSLELIKKNFDFKKMGKTEITADVFSYDKKNNIFYAEGLVKILQEGIEITADKVEYNLTSKIVNATGNVVIMKDGDHINCERVKLNLSDYSGEIEKGEIFVAERNFRIMSDNIQRDKSGGYTLKDVTLTSCDAKDPLWAFKCKEATISPEGIGKSKENKFKFNFLPYSVMYLPYMTFPAKTERTSGFLFPSFDLNTKFGLRYTQGYYWALDQSSDVTFYYDLMSQRGVKVGGEYRYMLTENGNGVFKMFFLDDGGGKKDDYAIFEDKNKRYFLNFQHNQEFDNNLKLYTNINLVSDINYKEDFSEDFKGNNFVNRHNEQAENSLTSILYLNKRIDYLNLTFDMEYYKDLTKTSNDTTSQKLPEVSLFISQNDFLGVGIYNMFNGEYLNIYRKMGESFSRVILKPTFSKPLSFSNYFITETEVSPTFAEYFFDINEDSLGNKNKIYTMLSNIGRTQVSRVYDFPYFGIIKLKHIVEPLYEYEYISKTPELFDRLRYFDYLDAEINKNILKYGVTQRVLSRFEDGSHDELLYWDIARALQIEREESFFGGRSNSNLYSDLKVKLSKYFSIDNNLEYDSNDKELDKFTLWGNIDVYEGSFFSAEYRYLKDEVEQLNFLFNAHFLDKFDVYNYLNYNYITGSLERSTYGVRFSPKCLSIDLSVTDENNPNNLSINFLLSLQGLGGFGNL